MSAVTESNRPRGVWHAIGPGILFAGAAVGVSHLIQSTRAGASFGVALIGVVIVANLIKYPAFRFGPEYTVATGRSLLHGYRQQGRGALLLYLLLTLGTMFTVMAAVTVVTAGLALNLTGLALSPLLMSSLLLAACALLLALGRYRWLDLATKVAVALFTIATLVATLAALGRINWSGPWMVDFGALSLQQSMFMAALIGWMPTAIDVSVWQSLWTVARARSIGRLPTRDAAMVDFHVGYIGTAVLAICFVLMGAAVLQNQTLPDRPAAFAALLVSMYSQTLGSWSTPVVATAALLVMFSTMLTVADGFPRALSTLLRRFQEDEPSFATTAEVHADRAYWAALAVLAVGAWLLLFFALRSLKELVDLATTISFLTAPLLAILNHRAVFADEMPGDAEPGTALKILSSLAIIAQLAFAGYYIWLRSSM